LAEGMQLLEGMDAVFEQSWRLLSAAERETLARVSIFQGGFSLEAAKGVAGASPPVLAALVDKSLLEKENGRLHMHPLLHHFAATKLANSSAAEETERAHALHFHRFMARVGRDIEHGNRDALQAMDVDCSNCRVAWRWSFSHDMREFVARSMPAMLN